MLFRFAQLLKVNIMPQAGTQHKDDYTTLHELHKDCTNLLVIVCRRNIPKIEIRRLIYSLMSTF